MKYYLIKESLTPCGEEEIQNGNAQFAAVLTGREWNENKERFNMGIDMGMEVELPKDTKAVVNMDSLTGTYSKPSLTVSGQSHVGFSFALDETGIVLVDDTGYVLKLVEQIRRSKRWRLPGLERFIYDLLELTISQDLTTLERIEQHLNQIELSIVNDEIEACPPEMNDIRGDLLDLRIHYEQLIDLSQELEENENGFFQEANLRYFHMFTERVIRLQNMVTGEREYVMQLRDLLQSNLDVKMNRIMTVLTVVTTIFLPLTLIAGWYGMNFRYMPELNLVWGYPAVIAVCVLIVVLSLIWFKKRKWL